MDNFILKEMDICRQYCSAIHRERQDKGFNSLRYPLISVKINRYFLPEFRELIAEDCNLIGYMDIKPVEYWEEVESYEQCGIIKIELDTTKSEWQEKLYKQRDDKRRENNEKKQRAS